MRESADLKQAGLLRLARGGLTLRRPFCGRRKYAIAFRHRHLLSAYYAGNAIVSWRAKGCSSIHDVVQLFDKHGVVVYDPHSKPA